jgi:outer membrane protein
MKNTGRICVVCCILMFLSIQTYAQETDSLWSLDDCIRYSLNQNISIRQSELTIKKNQINLEMARASRFPSVNASATQNFGWSKSIDSLGTYGSLTDSHSTSAGINSNVTVYNGLKNLNTIKQSKLTIDASGYDQEAISESVSLNIMDAYLQLLYAEESVKTSEEQIKSTTGQLQLAEERLALGAISRSDYLLVKSELASEKLALANALGLVSSNRINLMQLMELPASESFKIEPPIIDEQLSHYNVPSVDSVYTVALGIKPQIRSAELNNKIADLDIEIARAAYQPSLMMNGGISTGFSPAYNDDFTTQFQNRITPTVGISLSIPIYQNDQLHAGVGMAKINKSGAELEMLNSINQLRKEIEQACTNAIYAKAKYEAGMEQYNASREAYDVAEEKYRIGLISSVDFLIRKTNLINAESEFLQSRYQLLFSTRIIDFYQGKPLTF